MIMRSKSVFVSHYLEVLTHIYMCKVLYTCTCTNSRQSKGKHSKQTSIFREKSSFSRIQTRDLDPRLMYIYMCMYILYKPLYIAHFDHVAHGLDMALCTIDAWAFKGTATGYISHVAQ